LFRFADPLPLLAYALHGEYVIQPGFVCFKYLLDIPAKLNGFQD
jgi:hypothetical protein